MEKQEKEDFERLHKEIVNKVKEANEIWMNKKWLKIGTNFGKDAFCVPSNAYLKRQENSKTTRCLKSKDGAILMRHSDIINT